MEGTYKLADDTTGKCGLRLKEEEGGKLRVSVKVANSMNLVLTRAGDKWTGGPVMSTKAGGHLANLGKLLDESILILDLPSTSINFPRFAKYSPPSDDAGSRLGELGERDERSAVQHHGHQEGR